MLHFFPCLPSNLSLKSPPKKHSRGNVYFFVYTPCVLWMRFSWIRCARCVSLYSRVRWGKYESVSMVEFRLSNFLTLWKITWNRKNESETQWFRCSPKTACYTDGSDANWRDWRCYHAYNVAYRFSRYHRRYNFVLCTRENFVCSFSLKMSFNFSLSFLGQWK